ncbi:DNA-binding protein [Ruminobacter sp. RM87]|uniref:DNA-binding protein n=1 Tax=Ruminobacter sp. RM87 TaxID=1200567 RepID=UPI0012FC9E25|nr:DNA-binding protein [Ruminobacter sp. RM87]
MIFRLMMLSPCQTRRRVSKLCSEGRIKGAVLKGNTWLIPSDTQKPEDQRRLKQGRDQK